MRVSTRDLIEAGQAVQLANMIDEHIDWLASFPVVTDAEAEELNRLRSVVWAVGDRLRTKINEVPESVTA